MEKPFSCPMAGCNLSFVNEDHLTVHKKKHELSLTLTPTTSGKNPFIIDQTPTPTRFLNTLDLEFQDLQSDNPFEVTFRRANSTGASSNFVIPESSSLIANLPDSEVLNTPSITLPSEPATPISLKPNFPKRFSVKVSDNLTCTQSTDSLRFNDQVVQVVSSENISDVDLSSENTNFSSIASPRLHFPPSDDNGNKKNTPKNVLQTSVITSVGNSTVLKTAAVGVPTAVVVTRPPINTISTVTTSQVSIVPSENNQVRVQESAPAIVQPMCVAPVVQLMIRLPDGQTVHLPVVASAPTTQASQTVTPIAPQVTSTTSNSQMKVNEVYSMNPKYTVKRGLSAKSKSKPSIRVLSDDSFGLSISPPSSPFSSLKPTHNGRKRRDLVDDTDEKRIRSLERNRAAATRCREKRKKWTAALERKADELSNTNVQLQNEVSLLRNEVANLKTMLLAHKDCPVTLQQRASYEIEKESYPRVRIITSEDIQCVPNSSAISPLNSDFMEMEMEISSVQSSSDASLTSDTSETSCRER